MLPVEYQEFLTALQEFFPQERVYTDPLRTLAYGTDASVYRLVPKIVLDAETEAEVVQVLVLAQRFRLPVTFRAAGTSLSGQGVSDSILVRLGRGWTNFTVGLNAETITLQPGIIGGRANVILAEFGRKIGPDPASIDSCKIGGIMANNASGMCCGTSDNSYKTVISTRLILADGTVLDTADAKSRAEFSRTHGHILEGLKGLREGVMADKALADRIRKKFKIKNTTGYSLNALVDFEDPFEILQHVMVGSEGTLGFIAEVTYRTVEEHKHKASALFFFPSMHAACEAAITLNKAPLSAIELLDRASLRSVEGQPGLPEGLEALGPEVCALLMETRAGSASVLQEQITEVERLLQKHPTVLPGAFTADPEKAAALWLVRKGILPSVGGLRKTGTSLLIEDVAVPIEKLADAALDLQALFAKHEYTVAPVFGHARDGNLHFVITQDFSSDAEVARYAAFMDDLCTTITSKYDGSLKAEHGTGRNIAPFVEMEWGTAAFKLMHAIKKLLDPSGILNPGVVLNSDSRSHLKNLKPQHPAAESIDKCMECGFCEPACPSRNLSLTPRQRITAWREIQGVRSGAVRSADLKSLEKGFDYLGNATCATDGLCGTRCPLGINTGAFIKDVRAQNVGDIANSVAGFVGRHFAGVCRTVSMMLTVADAAHRTVGYRVMQNGSSLLRLVSLKTSPSWNRAMPTGGKKLSKSEVQHGNRDKVVYFPSCISRTMGPGAEHHDKRTEPEVAIALLLKAGFDVIIPAEVEALCCGMAFASKGLRTQAAAKEEALNAALLQATNNGSYPVLSETSPCLLHMKETLDKRLKLYEPVSFTLEYLKDRLEFSTLPKTVAVHATCSVRKLGLTQKLAQLARLCAQTVVEPEGIDCCGFAGDRGFTHPELNDSALQTLRMQVRQCEAGYSTSRTCQIGLSLHGGIPYYSIMYLVDEATRASCVKEQPAPAAPAPTEGTSGTALAVKQDTTPVVKQDATPAVHVTSLPVTVAETPAPVAEKPAPAAEKPVPVVEKAAPAAGTPAPVPNNQAGKGKNNQGAKGKKR